MKKIIAMSAVALAVSSGVQADVRINGFANLVGGITSSDDSLYGYDDNVSFSPESLFAIQVSGDINERMTATGQLVARGEDDYDVAFEWAYLTFQATDDTSISAGRLRMPLFRYSASLDVGYSYHWVVAPQSVYNVPFNNIDGVRVDFNGYSDDLEYTFQLTGGKVENDFTLAGQSARLQINNVIVGTAEFTYLNWKFRGVAARGDVTFDIPALEPAFAQLGQIDSGLQSLLEANDDSGLFYGASIEYDAFDWFVAAEFTGAEIEDSFYPDETNFYVTAGLRSGKWTPFITYEKSDLNDGPKFVDRIAGFPAPLQVPLTQLVIGIQQPAISENDTTSVGVRYDYDTNVALKVDVSKYSDDLDESQDATLVRFAVNYVF
ncbi:topoisomerase IV [Alteromonas sp. ASW11-36]|uniref:Topoisomerase IV n=1 Tax=Alteromonas arenosi TaxID=3055817 RepID=A0ABT7SWD1_9ALTE|nr:topoisomerase IV [Alteromonas sp. ASW11-36]MDM7860476.1 topoisomerase IV [Alteromonas sp. ASW11-36]